MMDAQWLAMHASYMNFNVFLLSFIRNDLFIIHIGNLLISISYVYATFPITNKLSFSNTA
jgi:hypothetical protein